MPALRSDARPVAPRIRLERLDDVEIAYTELPGEGVPLVLLHGLTGHRDDFLPQLPWLRARCGDLPLLVPDLRGHGDSSHPGDAAGYAFDRLVADLRLFLDRRGVARAHLLGHSFGGMVALRFALACPDRIESLLLVDTAPCAPDGFTAELFEKSGAIALARGIGFLQALIEARAREGSATRASDRAIARWTDDYWAHHRHRFRSLSPLAYRALGLAMVGQASIEDRLAEIAAPTTVIVGVDDEAFLAGAERLARGIPGAVRVDVEDAGHHPHRENTPAWLAAVSAHLERAAATRKR